MIKADRQNDDQQDEHDDDRDNDAFSSRHGGSFDRGQTRENGQTGKQFRSDVPLLLGKNLRQGWSMVQSAAAFLEPRLRPDGLSWEIVVIWGHTLRDRIPDLLFGSREEAITWIETRSKQWLGREQSRPQVVRTEKFAKRALVECRSKAALCEHKASMAADDNLRLSYENLARSWQRLASRAESVSES